MNFLMIMNLLQLWQMGLSQNSTEKSAVGSLIQGAKTAVSNVAEALDETVKRIPGLENAIFTDCIEPPEECPNSNITFWYYSRSRPDTPVQILVNDPETFNSLPKNQNPWKIIIHGYTKSKDEIPNPQLQSAYFKRGEYNLISVDYEPIARDKCYIQAVHNVPLIANCTAQMIDALIERDFFTSKELHVIGFSLGAQIAGLIHNYLKHEKPQRVTGLDPASPLFDGIKNHKLNQNAGDFVDVIHTNALFNGKLEPSGHVDFYVNGGLNQPGCLINNSGYPDYAKIWAKSTRFVIILYRHAFSTCSHDRSPLYFAESINSLYGFWGIPCSSYIQFYSGLCDTEDLNLVLMGEYVPHSARGTYYLETTAKEPFALGKKTKILANLKI